MKIIRVPDLGSTPARVHRPSGTVFLNNRVWDSIAPGVQKVILAHEAGHYALQTSNELAADKYAFEQYALSENMSLKNLLKAVTKYLDMNNEYHRERAEKQIIRILETDARLGNNKAKIILNKMTAQNTALMVNKLQAENPGVSREDIELALYYAAALKSSLSGYSDASGKKGFAKFFAKAGDKFGEMMQKPGLQKIVSAAGAMFAIPPAAISAGMTAIGKKIEVKSEAKLIKIGTAEDKAKIEAQQAQRAADTAKLQADKLETERKVAEAAKLQADKLEAERKAAEFAKSANQMLGNTADGGKSQTYDNASADQGTKQGGTGVKAGISIGMWLLIALLAGAAIYFVTKQE